MAPEYLKSRMNLIIYLHQNEAIGFAFVRIHHLGGELNSNDALRSEAPHEEFVGNK